MPQLRPHRNFYGRRHGLALRPSQRTYLAEDLGALRVPGASWSENPQRKQLDLAALFARHDEIWLEIGFGAGEHMVAMAAANPHAAIIGAEYYINGVATLLGRIRRAGVSNIGIHAGDVRDLMDVLPAAAVSRAFLNYPDPWPKLRHHRRRFVTPEYLRPLYRAMRPGAELRIATDIPDYVRQTLEEVPAAGFLLVGQGRRPWEDWPSTRYEQKALRAGRQPHYVTFRR